MANGSDERQPLLSRGDARRLSNAVERLENDQSLSRDDLKENEHLLVESLYPHDSFGEELYWADMIGKERSLWIKDSTRREWKREVDHVRQLAKAGFFEPVRAYCRTYARSGTGFFVEGYVLFSVGNVMPLFKSLWPQCWLEHETCSGDMIKAIKYMEIVGIICGQLIVGYIGDAIGRRWGLVQDAGIMLMGAILLTALGGPSMHSWTIMYVVAIFIFGLGVGGEYPMTSTTSIEGMKGLHDRSHRGRKASLAFAMQGWGQLANQLVLILIATTSSPTKSLKPPYTETQVQVTFRTTFGIAVLCLIYFLYLRISAYKDADDDVRKDQKQQNRGSGYDWSGFKFVLSRFWARLFATSVCWFCSDFAFYGMQIFRNDLIKLVTGTTSKQVDTIWLYNLINIGCQLIGYHLAALLVDHKAYGRKRMQEFGFLALFAIYVAIACSFTQLSQPGIGYKVFQALFFLAGFWTQFGPNSTTFLIAAEVYPVSVRSTAHGFSAAVGKLGALVATISFNYIEDRTKFIAAAAATLVGLILTMLLVPDTTGLDLAEMQRAWSFVTGGRQHDYHGLAINPQHLSWFERYVRQRHKMYDMEHDRQQRVAELREMYQKGQEDLERANNELDPASEHLLKYFELEQSRRQ